MTELLSFCKAKNEVGHGLLVATVKTARGIGVDIVGAIHTQQMAQLVLKKGVMKLLHEIHRGDKPESQLVRLGGLEERKSKLGLLGMTTMMELRPKVKKSQTKPRGLIKVYSFYKVGQVIKCKGEWKVISKPGLNWKSVYLLAISTEVVPQADAAWHSPISDMVRAGLEESDQWPFLSGLLLAWHAALCATQSFSFYCAWFQPSFLPTLSRSHQLLVSQQNKTDNVQYQVTPHEHRKKINKFYWATAMAANADWASMPIIEKIQIQMADIYRADLNATTMLGQCKTMVQVSRNKF